MRHQWKPIDARSTLRVVLNALGFCRGVLTLRDVERNMRDNDRKHDE